MPMVARGNPTGYGEAFAAEMQDFLLSILNGTPMDTSFEVGARTMHVITAALESARTKQSVSVPNLGTTVSGGNGTR
jgi:predicted dehydrogenase